MSSVLLRSVLSLFTAHAVICTAIASRSHNRGVSSFDSLHLYPRPAYLPIMPYYEVDIPEQEGKFFGVMAATRYETVSIPFNDYKWSGWSWRCLCWTHIFHCAQLEQYWYRLMKQRNILPIIELVPGSKTEVWNIYYFILMM